LVRKNNKDNSKRNSITERNSLDHTSSVNADKRITDKSPDVTDATDRHIDKPGNDLKSSTSAPSLVEGNISRIFNTNIKNPASDTSVSSGDNPLTIECNNTKEQKLQLTHSKSAHVMTNEDLDVEEEET
jgi:hypothetical protein